MPEAVLVMATLLPVLMAAAFLLGRHLHRRQAAPFVLSPVSQQHIELLQGGELNETAVEAAKDHFRQLLERGEVAQVEACLRPGMEYIVHVRALAELGTDDAGRILERQLQQRLTDDQIEQSWYWIDLANGLRSLNRSQSLPQVLECAETAGPMPLGHFFAAEAVCFVGFAGYLRRPDSPLGRSALRTLKRAMEGLRTGVQPHLVAEARLGDMIEQLWDHRSKDVDPLVVRVFFEALRLLRRAPHAETCFTGEASEQEAFNWQLQRLAALEPVLVEYLHEAPARLCRQLCHASGPDRQEVLLALADLRAEAADVILPLLDSLRAQKLRTSTRMTEKKTTAADYSANDPQNWADVAIEVLTWSRNPHVAPYLRQWAASRVPMQRRARRQQFLFGRRSAVPADMPYRAILRALRGHPSGETEDFLLLAARDRDPSIRLAAIGSLGWWEPEQPQKVNQGLQDARRDPFAEVRQAARAALARLGERQALQWFRQILTSEEPQRVHEALHVVGSEGIMLLWPDLDRLADSEDPDIARHCRETLERLSEEMESRR